MTFRSRPAWAMFATCRKSGSPCARQADRLQTLPDSLQEDTERPLGRARAIGGGTADLRARARDPGVCAGRVLVADGHANAAQAGEKASLSGQALFPRWHAA